MTLFMPTLTLFSIGHAATEDEIEESIIKGLAWLAVEQNPDGRWGFSDEVAITGLAVLKFIDRAKELGVDPFSEEYEYHMNVTKGLNYIFEYAHIMDITAIQPHGDPDTDGDGWGVYFETIDVMWHRSYSTGISLMAIGAADACADKLGNPAQSSPWDP
jgi:hypothetical protein